MQSRKKQWQREDKSFKSLFTSAVHVVCGFTSKKRAELWVAEVQNGGWSEEKSGRVVFSQKRSLYGSGNHRSSRAIEYRTSKCYYLWVTAPRSPGTNKRRSTRMEVLLSINAGNSSWGRGLWRYSTTVLCNKMGRIIRYVRGGLFSFLLSSLVYESEICFKSQRHTCICFGFQNYHREFPCGSDTGNTSFLQHFRKDILLSQLRLWSWSLTVKIFKLGGHLPRLGRVVSAAVYTDSQVRFQLGKDAH